MTGYPVQLGEPTHFPVEGKGGFEPFPFGFDDRMITSMWITN